MAVACLVDLLDELRVSESEVATDAVVRRIKSLRAELVELKEQRPPRGKMNIKRVRCVRAVYNMDVV